jgi:DNA-binding transcriptional MerR regulator
MFALSSTSKPIASLHVAALARRACVTPATIRYYSRIGLLNPDRDLENGYRRFSTSDLHRVVFIRQAQALGLTIGDIKAILETIDRGKPSCHQVKQLVQQRLLSIRRKLFELTATEARISLALDSWHEMRDAIPLDGELCPLIERLDLTAMPDGPPTRPVVCKSDTCGCSNTAAAIAI